MASKQKKFIIIDGNALLHRAWHALPPTMTTRSGEVVNAVYGFTLILLKVLKDLKPDYLAVTFDMKGPTFRHKEYKEYKANREKKPDELYGQLPRIKEVVGAFNIPIYEKQGFAVKFRHRFIRHFGRGCRLFGQLLYRKSRNVFGAFCSRWIYLYRGSRFDSGNA